ncbi:MAG: DUF4349 domain-containing protein [Dehalococcoidia bacterium]
MSKWLTVLTGLALVVALIAGIACTSDSGDDELMEEHKSAAEGTGERSRGLAGPPGPTGTKVDIEGAGLQISSPVPQEETVLFYGNTQVSGGSTIDRMIVRTGQMNLKVADVGETLNQIKTITQSLGGYVVSSDWQAGEEENSATISIRVPAKEYESATLSLRDLAIEVLYESTRAQDVTEEYTDLEAQLRNLEATEERYLQLLEKAETVEEMLDVEEELSDTRGRIEQIQGRMQYLEQTSATSLINVHLMEESPLEADFEVDKIKVKVGERAYFTNQTTGGCGPYGYTWDFGNGDTDTSSDPGWHIYDKAGEYTVSLTVTDDKGNESTEIKEAYITVVGKSGWSAGDVAGSAWDGLVAFGHFLAHISIWIGILAVIWVPILAIALVIRWWRKKAA